MKTTEKGKLKDFPIVNFLGRKGERAPVPSGSQANTGHVTDRRAWGQVGLDSWAAQVLGAEETVASWR